MQYTKISYHLLRASLDSHFNGSISFLPINSRKIVCTHCSEKTFISLIQRSLLSMMYCSLQSTPSPLQQFLGPADWPCVLRRKWWWTALHFRLRHNSQEQTFDNARDSIWQERLKWINLCAIVCLRIFMVFVELLSEPHARDLHHSFIPILRAKSGLDY